MLPSLISLNVALLKQAYRKMLLEFRTSTLPRQFNKTFSEAPEPHIIRDRLARLSVNFDRLQRKGEQTKDFLNDLTVKHQQYNGSMNNLLGWLQSAEQNLVQLIKEPVPTEPKAVQAQIDKLRVSL